MLTQITKPKQKQMTTPKNILKTIYTSYGLFWVFKSVLNTRFDHITYLFWTALSLTKSCMDCDSRKGRNFTNIWTTTNIKEKDTMFWHKLIKTLSCFWLYQYYIPWHTSLFYLIYSLFGGSFNSYFLSTYSVPGILGAREIMVPSKRSFPVLSWGLQAVVSSR